MSSPSPHLATQTYLIINVTLVHKTKYRHLAGTYISFAPQESDACWPYKLELGARSPLVLNTSRPPSPPTDHSPKSTQTPTPTPQAPLSHPFEYLELQMMVHRLKDVVIVLTGASSGIGASIAEHLLKEGAKVRDPKLLSFTIPHTLNSFVQ